MAGARHPRRPVIVADSAEPARKGMKISAEMKAMARMRRGAVPFSEYFAIPQPAPGVIPEGGSTMAMDDALGASTNWAAGYFHSAVAEGQTFLGYPVLAVMAQRAEYRIIVETIADEMTRKWIELKCTSEDDDKSDKLKAIKDEFERLKVRQAFKRAVEMDGFFGRGHIFIDTGDTDRNELTATIGDGRNATSRFKITPDHPIKALKAIEPVWCYPTAYNSSNPMEPDWYRPNKWFVMGKEIDASRFLTFIGREVPDLLKPAYSFGGLSMTQMAKPYVDNWLRTRQSVSDMLHSFSTSVLKTNMQNALGGALDSSLYDRADVFNDIRDSKGVMLLDMESEDFSNVSAPLGTLDSLQAQAQEQIASVARIPLVKLTGISPSGLNASSEGEIKVFYDSIHSYQEVFFGDALKRILGFIQLSLYGEVDPEIVADFMPLDEMTEIEEAQYRLIETQTDEALVQIGAISPAEVRKRVADDIDSPYAGLDISELPVSPGVETTDAPLPPDSPWHKVFMPVAQQNSGWNAAVEGLKDGIGQSQQAWKTALGFDDSGAAQGDGRTINRQFDVPYLAGSSNDGKTTYIDRRLPEQIYISGRWVDPAKYLNIHETVEHREMQWLIGLGMDAMTAYRKAHTEVATPAERAALKADGLDWNEYEKVLDGYLDETEREMGHPMAPPPDLYVKPYPHREASFIEAQAQDAYDPSEAREPAGAGGGGRWTSGSAKAAQRAGKSAQAAIASVASGASKAKGAVHHLTKLALSPDWSPYKSANTNKANFAPHVKLHAGRVHAFIHSQEVGHTIHDAVIHFTIHHSLHVTQTAVLGMIEDAAKDFVTAGLVAGGVAMFGGGAVSVVLGAAAVYAVDHIADKLHLNTSGARSLLSTVVEHLLIAYHNRKAAKLADRPDETDEPERMGKRARRRHAHDDAPAAGDDTLYEILEQLKDALDNLDTEDDEPDDDRQAEDAFDPSEQRDQTGKWAASGGGGAQAPEAQAAKEKAAKASKPSLIERVERLFGGGKKPASSGGKPDYHAILAERDKIKDLERSFDSPLTDGAYPLGKLAARKEALAKAMAAASAKDPVGVMEAIRQHDGGDPADADVDNELAFYQAHTPDKIAIMPQFFYHGTSDQAADSILKEGLVPHHGGGADDWGAQKGMNIQKFTIGERQQSVYLTSSLELAETYANIAAEQHPGTKSAVLKVVVPKDKMDHLKYDEMSRVSREDTDTRAFRFVGPVDPKWISVAEKFEPGKGTFTPAQDDEGGATIYIVVPTDGGDPDDEGAEDAYNPSEPRQSGGKGAGRWTKGGGSGVSEREDETPDKPTGGSSGETKPATPATPSESPAHIESRVRDIAKKMGYDPSRVHYGGPPTKVSMKGMEGTMMGVSISAGNATYNGKNYKAGDIVLFGNPKDATIAHEVMHKKFDLVMHALALETKEMPADATDADGVLKPELTARFPIYAAIGQYLSFGFPGRTNKAANKVNLLARTDGVSNYSTAYWFQYVEDTDKDMDIWTPINETLAEMAANHIAPQDGAKPAAKPWRDIYDGINKQYDRLTKQGWHIGESGHWEPKDL